MRSHLGLAVCLLFALLGISRTAPADDSAAEKRIVRSVTITLADAESFEPLADAPVQYLLNDGRYNARSDQNGQVTIPLPTGTLYGLVVEASPQGYVPLAAAWRSEVKSAEIPVEHTLLFERGTPIGGRVTDDAGNPVAGATVSLLINKQRPNPAEYVNITFKSLKTDADGKWNYPTAPATADQISVGAYHTDYVMRAFYELHDVENPQSLQDGTHTLQLERGVAVEGTVTDSNGRPLADARIGIGSRRFGINSTPELRTDGLGRYRLVAKPGEEVILTVKARGLAPELVKFVMPAEPHTQNIQLKPAAALRGMVVNPEGEPIPEAWVYVESWRGLRSLPHRLKTDSEGRFYWGEAPADSVVADVDAHGYQRKREVALRSDGDNRIVLNRPTVVRGTVVDAGTGKPVPSFRIVNGIGWQREDIPIHWERDPDDVREGTDGRFEFGITFPYPGHAVRIEADGYRPADSEVFKPDAGLVELEFKLEKSELLTGRIVGKDGKPVADVPVHLIPPGSYVAITKGRIPGGRQNLLQVTTGSDGTFRFPPQGDRCMVVALSEAGYGEAWSDKLSDDHRIVLEPWGRIEGVAGNGTRPASGISIKASAPISHSPGGPTRSISSTATTDAEGRFACAYIPPSQIQIGREKRAGRDIDYDNIASVTVKPGETVTVQLGGVGRPVIGRFVMPEGTPAIWTAHNASLVRNVKHPKSGVPEEVTRMSPEQKQAWYAEWLKTPEGKAYQEAMENFRRESRRYGVTVNSDGTFSASDVEAGTYTLSIRIREGGRTDHQGADIAVVKAEVTVDPIPGGVMDEPLELPVLEAQRLVNLKVGDIAPPFTTRTLDGQEVKLSDLAGKYILLDFWATWCGPCLAETPALKALHEKYGSDERFVMVGLSLDSEPAAPLKYTQTNELNWEQWFLGDWSEDSVTKLYGVRAIPSIWLIGPDGKVIAKGLRGPQLEEAVSQALHNSPDNKP